MANGVNVAERYKSLFRQGMDESEVQEIGDQELSNKRAMDKEMFKQKAKAGIAADSALKSSQQSDAIKAGVTAVQKGMQVGSASMDSSDLNTGAPSPRLDKSIKRLGRYNKRGLGPETDPELLDIYNNTPYSSSGTLYGKK